MARQRQLERALSKLCLTISRETGNRSVSGLERARALRSAPAQGGKSHYECINQLIHYWYCCAAARHLLKLGFRRLEIRPTGHDNANDLADDEADGGPYDIRAVHDRLGTIVGEVFCVSDRLWWQKMKKTRAKLEKSKAAVRAVFYNEESKPSWRPTLRGLVAFGVRAASSQVVEIACTADLWHRVAGSEPNNAARR